MDHTKGRDSLRRSSQPKRPVQLGFASASKRKTRRFATVHTRGSFSPNNKGLGLRLDLFEGVVESGEEFGNRG
jgi:hypothetical protein